MKALSAIGTGGVEGVTPRRVVFIMPTITTYVLFLRELSEKLANQGWSVHLICSGQHVSAEYNHRGDLHVTLHVLEVPRGMNPVAHLLAARRLHAVVRAIAPDLIHVHAESAVFVAALAGMNRLAPTIATVHGLNSPQMHGMKKATVRLAERWCFSHMDVIYLVNKADEQYASALRGRFERYTTYALGCDIRRFDPAAIPADVITRLREKLGLTPFNFVFAFVGRQVAFKGFAAVVRAFIQIHRRHPNARLLLVGVSDPLHPNGLTKVETRELKIHPGICHAGWQIDVQNFLAISHVNVFPSEREGLPVNVMESLAMGVPVIAIESRGCTDLVRDGVDGIIVPGVRWLSELNTEILAAAMENLMLDPRKWQQLRDNALSRRQSFDRRLWNEEQTSIYERLVTNSLNRRSELEQ